MKKTAIYIRVSNIKGQRFDSQLHELNRWIELHKPEAPLFDSIIDGSRSASVRSQIIAEGLRSAGRVISVPND